MAFEICSTVTNAGKQGATGVGSLLAIGAGGYLGYSTAGFFSFPGAAAAAQLFAYIPVVPVVGVGLLIAARLLMKYSKDPFMALGTNLVLGVSTAIVAHFVNTLIMSAFVTATVNPFTLPFVVAAGVAALCMIALYYHSKPWSPTVQISRELLATEVSSGYLAPVDEDYVELQGQDAPVTMTMA